MRRKKRIRSKTLERPVEERKLGRKWILGIILGVTFLTFANTLGNDFAYDDQTFILENQLIKSASVGEAISKLPVVLTKELWFYRVLQDKDPNKDKTPTTPYYRPTFAIFQMICWLLFGANAAGWHFANILVHMLAVYFVFLILERVSKDLKVTAIGTLLFAVHPLRAESVAWICGISDPFLAIFLLPSFYFYLRYRGEGHARNLFVALLLFLFAAFTKEPAVALAIFIGVYEIFLINQDKPLGDRIAPAIKYSICFLFVSALYFGARYYALGFALNNERFKSYPFDQILMTIPLVILKYVGLLFFPVNMTLFHATYMVKSPLDIKFFLPLLGLIGLVYGLWRLRKSVVARFAILWFAVNLLPVLNLSAFAEDFLVQERYVYIPSVGFSLLVALLLAKIPIENWISFKNRAVAQTALVAILVFCLAGKSLAQNTVWKDDMTLWRYGVDSASDQFMSHFILGFKLINLKDYRGAADQFEECMKFGQYNQIVYSNLAAANVLIFQYESVDTPGAAERARLDRAVELCEQGLKIGGDFPPFWDTLGQVYSFETGLKNLDRAVACFQRGLSLNPANALITFHLGGALAKKGDLENGMHLLRTALELDPSIADAHKFLGYAYKAKGQYKEAIDELKIYLRLQPDAADATRIGKDVQDMRSQTEAVAPPS
jgi:protein O-mannosyl-transferase